MLKPNDNASWDEELALGNQLLERWIVGGALSTAQLPIAWQALVEELPAPWPNLFSLALATHQQLLLSRPAPALPFKPAQPLPQLDKPIIANELRALVRRCLAKKSLRLSNLLNLIATRGHTLHPADWLPTNATEALPEVYWPWRRWQLGISGETALDASNWADMPCAQRLLQLHALRRSNPSEARQLLATCGLSGTAEQRLALLASLAHGLNLEDAEFLRNQTRDRAESVREQAVQLLSRLGLDEPSDTKLTAAAQDLAGQLAVETRGLFTKTRHLVPSKLKTKELRAARTQKFSGVTFCSLATALGLSPEDLGNLWSFDEHSQADSAAFLLLASLSASDAIFQLLLDRYLHSRKQDDELPYNIEAILNRLPPPERGAVLLQLWQAPGLEFSWRQGLPLLDEPLDTLSWAVLAKTRAWVKLAEALKTHIQEQAYLSDTSLQAELTALGLLLPHPAALQCLEACKQLGLLMADPALDTLKLNCQLPPLALSPNASTPKDSL